MRTLMTSLFLVALSAPWFSVARADDAEALRGLLDSKSPSVVSVRAVVKMEMSGFGQAQDQEHRLNMQGVVVDAKGLVLVTNTSFSPNFPGMRGGGIEIKMTPVELKVIFENEAKEYDARLVAKDTKVQLAFLQIEELGDRKLTPIDFSDGAKVAVGDALVSINRLSKGFDYAPYYSTGSVGGRVKKPRRAWIPAGAVGQPGQPVFTTGGKVVGVITTLESGVDEDAAGAGNPFAMLSMLRGGMQGSLFILPARSVATVIQQAREQAAEASEDSAEEDSESEESEN